MTKFLIALFIFIFAQTILLSQVTQEWVQRYGNQANGFYNVAGVAVDNSGNVFVSGSITGSTLTDYNIIKYNSFGVFQWERVYTNPQNGGGGNDIVNDKFGNVYITGGSNDYITIKYNTNGDSLWAMNYNGPSNLNDIAKVLAIDNSGNVYVSGISRETGSSSNYDMATIKYSQSITNITYHNGTPEEIKLHQNYPNPFNPKTIINFQFAAGESMFSKVKLIIFDTQGREVETLINKELSSGNYDVEWDATNFPSGIYFYKLISIQFVETKKMLVIK